MPLIIFLLMVWTGFGFGMDLTELETDHQLTFELSTPHTKWARPYAGGKCRVLFFADGRGTQPREAVELMQRFDIEARAVFLANVGESTVTGWLGGDLGERRMLALLREHWDCIVFLGVPIALVPPVQKGLILDAVAGGTGIVFVGTDEARQFPGKKRFDPTPLLLDPEDRNDAFAVGKGRAAFLPPRPKIGYYEGWEVDYDYWQQRLGRAVLWSAAREPKATLDLHLDAKAARGGETVVSAESTPRLRARLSGRPSGVLLTLRLALRSPGRAPILLPPRSISAEQAAEVTLPRLSDGSWHVDARVTGPTGVETWATIPFTVSSERVVSLVKLDKSFGDPGETLSGKVLLAGTPRPKELLRVQLLDRRRRELLRRDVAVKDGMAQFEFPVVPWLPMLVTVEARLYSAGTELSRSYRYFRVTKRKQGQFNFVLWGAPKETLAPYAEKSLADNGVTVQYDSEGPPLQVGAYDISWVPHSTHIGVDKSPNGCMRPWCWNDPQAARRQVQALLPGITGAREQGALVYSLGDENKTLGSCLCPFCAKEYRTYLKQSYGSLDDLNRSWGTGYASWGEVGLSGATDDEEAGSKKNRNYARWFDRQAYKSWNYQKFCRKHADGYRELDPQARSGFDGAAGFATGDDLDLIARTMGFWVPYPGLADEVIRSVAPRDFVRSNWIGGRDKSAGPLLQKYWRLVTLGADSVWWWMWSCIGELHGFLAPDLRPFPEIKEVVEDTRIVREGLGDLLLRSTMQEDGIAILYSYPSLFAHKLDEGAGFFGYEESHRTLTKFIRDSGYQFRYLTDRMIRQGEFDLSTCRILFLPRAEALGDLEAAAIRKFVENGGTVVADLRPGLYDDHCKVRLHGVLDGLFGVRRLSRTPARSIRFRNGTREVETLTDAGVALDGARGRTAEGVPVWLNRRVGKGRAILLNAGMGSFPEFVWSFRTPAEFWGGKPVVKVSGVKGRIAQELEITRWRDEGIQIVSLLSKAKASQEVIVSFPGTKYVYDLRARKSYGPCQEFPSTILPDRASFFVLTDRPAPPPELTLNSPDLRQGGVAIASLVVPGSEGMHAVRVTVEAGDRHLDWQDRTVIVGAKPVTVEIPIAFNDPVGDYRVTCTDLFSNEKKMVPFKVIPAR